MILTPQEKIDDAVQKLCAQLGQDTVADALQKLASKDPGKLKFLLKML